MTPGEPPRLRVVPDPNILVSSFISPLGIPAAILSVWEVGGFELIVSQRLVDELRDVLLRPKFDRPGIQDAVDAFVHRLSAAFVAADPPTRRVVPGDEKDDYIIVLAQATGADYVVSGDPLNRPVNRPGKGGDSGV